jgi:hypothetical protein
MESYKAKQGDCIESIAIKHGMFWETIWNDPKNKELVDKRGNPNIIMPGDDVYIPDKREGQLEIATEQCHHFVRKGVPSRLKVRFLDEEGKPYDSIKYVLEVDGVILKDDETTSDGWIKETIPPNAKQGKIIFKRGQHQEVFTVNLGHMNPFDTLSGLQQRLNNLGYSCGSPTGEMKESTKAAVRSFRKKNGMEESNSVDTDLYNKVKQIYGA